MTVLKGKVKCSMSLKWNLNENFGPGYFELMYRECVGRQSRRNQTALRPLIRHRHRRRDDDGWIFNWRLNSELKDLEKEVSVSSGDKRWCGRSESCSRWRTQASVSETAVLSDGSTCVYFKRQLTQSSTLRVTKKENGGKTTFYVWFDCLHH